MRLRFKILFVSLCLLWIVFLPVSVAQQTTVTDVRKNDFKVTMLSLGSGSSRFTYERAFNPKHSGEFTLGVIGMGWDWMNHCNPVGALLKMAYKFRLQDNRFLDSWLEGFYLKPELVCAHFSHDTEDKSRATTNQVALLAEGGYQLIHKWFVFDLYLGLGPSLGSGNVNNYYHSFMLFPSDGWLAFTAGYRVGVAF